MNDSELWITLSKVLPYAIYPLTWCLGLGVLGLIVVQRRRRRAGIMLIAAGFAILCVAASPVTANWLYSRLEQQFPAKPIAELPNVDVIVLLGGVLRLPLPPRTDFELTGTSSRIRYAAQLYRAGRAPNILVSGGNVFD